MNKPTQNLDESASKAADDLTAQLLSPLTATLSSIEGIFPGISDRLAEKINPEKLKSEINAEVANRIRALMKEGSEDSLRAALAKVTELRTSVEEPIASPENKDAHVLTNFESFEKVASVFENVKILMNSVESMASLLERASQSEEQITADNVRTILTYGLNLGHHVTKVENSLKELGDDRLLKQHKRDFRFFQIAFYEAGTPKDFQLMHTSIRLFMEATETLKEDLNKKRQQAYDKIGRMTRSPLKL